MNVQIHSFYVLFNISFTFFLNSFNLIFLILELFYSNPAILYETYERGLRCSGRKWLFINTKFSHSVGTFLNYFSKIKFCKVNLKINWISKFMISLTFHFLLVQKYYLAQVFLWIIRLLNFFLILYLHWDNFKFKFIILVFSTKYSILFCIDSSTYVGKKIKSKKNLFISVQHCPSLSIRNYRNHSQTQKKKLLAETPKINYRRRKRKL